MVTIYYRSPDLVVTDRLFELRYPYQRYCIDELDEVHVVRWPLDTSVVASAHATVCATAVVVASWPLLRTPNAWLLAAALIAVPGVVGGACLRARPRPYELRATYRAHRVLLYRSSDARSFGQVQRALTRALEASRGRVVRRCA